MPHTSSQLNHFARFGLVGAAMGAGLLSTVILFSCWYETQSDAYQGMRWYDGLSFFPALHGVWSGALIGATNGISAWAMLTRRRVHSLVTALASAVLAATLVGQRQFIDLSR